MGFEPARQRYIASQKPNLLPTELSGTIVAIKVICGLPKTIVLGFGHQRIRIFPVPVSIGHKRHFVVPVDCFSLVWNTRYTDI